MSNIGVLGGGSWGTALAMLLSENNHNVKVWLRDKQQCELINKTKINSKYLPNVILVDSIIFSTDIDEVLSDSDVILNSIPTQNIRKVFNMIPKKYLEQKIIINSAKGIELGTHNLISEILAEECSSCRYVVLSGPSHAEEVSMKMPTAVTAASIIPNF